ncbi:MAG: amylo-alpha-1,6-glucosidase [Pseudomonadota bacterium]
MDEPRSGEDLLAEGLERAHTIIRRCSTEHGFLASPTKHANYRRIWARDGTVLGLAALMSGDPELIETFGRTLRTLERNQGPHGEIPSNVDPASQRVSFGGTTGRVDASLWFVIGCGEYWQCTGDDDFIEAMLPALERVRFLLGAWEFNNRGLLYIPETGDWADEYIQSGYVLYDQVLYMQALRTICVIHEHVHGSSDHVLLEKIGRLYHLLRANYWFNGTTDPGPDAYHEVLFRHGLEAAKRRPEGAHYWLPFFSPSGYGFRFDAFANVLVSLMRVAYDDQRTEVDRFIEGIVSDELPLLPAFHPAIDPEDQDWEDLQLNFSYTFRNHPHEYHNGGLWPLITGFYVADLALRGKHDAARRHQAALVRANALPMEGEPWSFPEFVHGREFTPGGTRFQGWSAAAVLVGHYALEGESVIRIGHEL